MTDDILSIFQYMAPIPNSKGNPFSGDSKYKGWEFFCDFQLKSAFISETVRDRPMVAIER